MKNFLLFPSQFEQIVDLLRGSGAYLVGGAVRDLALNHPVHDLDFALPKGTIPAAKKVADRLDGGFFVLDAKRQTCRVILRDNTQKRLVVDFTRFQGEQIEDDLASRDFTITSMALDLEDLSEIIDPFRGRQDLLDGLIRPTSATALREDPLRCVRAVRLAAQLGFQILPETREQIRLYQSRLKDISKERVRDELFRLLDGPNLAAGILSLKVLGLYPYLIPGDLSDGRTASIRGLEGIWSLFLAEHDQEKAGSWTRGLLVHRLGRYREQIQDYLRQELVPDRSFQQLTYLIPLLSDLPIWEEPLTPRQISDRIPLSNQEADFLVKGILAIKNWGVSDPEQGSDQPVDVFRFFSRYGQAGLSAILIDLGAGLESRSGEIEQKEWIGRLDRARLYLEGYWERYHEWVDPPLFLNGNDIQEHFNLAPGPEIGSLLNAVREEQVRGRLRTRQEGLDYLANVRSKANGR